MEQTSSRRDLIAQLAHTPHGALADYLPVATKACADDPEFYAHLTAWNAERGEVRDAKVALPVLGMGRGVGPVVFHAHHLGLLAGLNPREFLRAVNFAKDLGPTINQRMIRRLVERYLREYEADPRTFEWDATIHRKACRALYTRWHIAPNEWANLNIVRGHPTEGRLALVRSLPDLSPVALADVVVRNRLPFQQVAGAIGAKIKEPDVVVALIERMTAGQLAGNLKWLQTLGMNAIPAARAALERAIGKQDKPGPTLKLGKAAAALEASQRADEGKRLVKQVRAAQEKKLDQKSIEGNWLVLADCSGSMEVAITTAIQITAVLVRLVHGRVRWIFFNETPRPMDTAGLTLDRLQAAAAHVTAGGGTSIGCGLRYVLERKETYDGIVLVSDGAENASPLFAHEYLRAAKVWDKPVPVYWYHVLGDLRAMYATDAGCNRYNLDDVVAFGTRIRQQEIEAFQQRNQLADIEVHRFDLTTGTVDAYSLPNLVQTMRAHRYSLVDEIMETPLVTLDEVLPLTARAGLPVLLREGVHAC